MKLGVLLAIYHSNNEIFFVVMLCHGKLDRSLFCMAGPKGLCYSRHLAEIAEEKSCASFREILSFSCIHIYFPKSRYDCK